MIDTLPQMRADQLVAGARIAFRGAPGTDELYVREVAASYPIPGGQWRIETADSMRYTQKPGDLLRVAPDWAQLGLNEGVWAVRA